MGLTPSPPEERGSVRTSGDGSTLAVLGITAAAAVCCGLPLLVAAVIATGAGGWLLAHESLVGLLAIGTGGGLFWWRWRRTRC